MSEGKVLLVTGASSEVGASLIRRIGPQYSTVFAHYRSSEETIADLRAAFGDRIVPLQADFSEERYRIISSIFLPGRPATCSSTKPPGTVSGRNLTLPSGPL